ncbi:hypothetical protein IAD21_00082 [Abditibacteriota bacterium]|nr:hypothetical protein IAD21_00082 [Abditibacteriota bacterium]
MNCPIDNTPLAITERQGIEIDYCPKCRGVWLDRGELDKLTERSAQYETRRTHEDDCQGVPQGEYPPQQAPYPQNQNQRQGSGPDIAGIVGDIINKGLDKRHQPNESGGQHKRKKGGLLGELFDF